MQKLKIQTLKLKSQQRGLDTVEKRIDELKDSSEEVSRMQCRGISRGKGERKVKNNNNNKK